MSIHQSIHLYIYIYTNMNLYWWQLVEDTTCTIWFCHSATFFLLPFQRSFSTDNCCNRQHRKKVRQIWSQTFQNHWTLPRAKTAKMMLDCVLVPGFRGSNEFLIFGGSSDSWGSPFFLQIWEWLDLVWFVCAGWESNSMVTSRGLAMTSQCLLLFAWKKALWLINARFLTIYIYIIYVYI